MCPRARRRLRSPELLHRASKQQLLEQERRVGGSRRAVTPARGGGWRAWPTTCRSAAGGAREPDQRQAGGGRAARVAQAGGGKGRRRAEAKAEAR